jgi:hypothetical protein
MRNFKIVLFIFVFALMGCGKSPLFNKVDKVGNPIAGQIMIEEGYSLKWIVAPTLDDLSSAEISLKEPLAPTMKLHAYLWMPDMGHGSSPIEIKQLNATDFVISELAFIMPGLWVLHLEISENNRIITQWQKSLTL